MSDPKNIPSTADQHPVVCFGELLLRLSPDADGKWLESESMPVFVGGAELNVAGALALWGLPVRYATVLPDTAVSQQLAAFLQRLGIDTSAVVTGEGRLGLYYLLPGSDLKGGGVIYDRAGSAIARYPTGRFPWTGALHDAGWFHVSAITPALSAEAAALTEEALQAAVQAGCTISIDLNYRARLWQYGPKPAEIMQRLLGYAHIVMGNVWAAQDLLAIPVAGDLHERGQMSDYAAQARETALVILRQWPSVRQVAQTFRFDRPGGGVRYFATMDSRESQDMTDVQELASVTDKAGSGDCFMAGLIYGHRQGWQTGDILRFAAHAATGKLRQAGDRTRQPASDILTQANLLIA